MCVWVRGRESEAGYRGGERSGAEEEAGWVGVGGRERDTFTKQYPYLTTIREKVRQKQDGTWDRMLMHF